MRLVLLPALLWTFAPALAQNNSAARDETVTVPGVRDIPPGTCSLTLLNSVPLTVTDNVVSVPASVGTKEKQFQIDTAALDNQMGRDAVNDFGLATLDFTASQNGNNAGSFSPAYAAGTNINGTAFGRVTYGSASTTLGGNAIAIYNARGTMFHSWVDAKPFILGSMQNAHLQFVVTDFPQPGSGGILSADFFQKYDIDLNFWGQRFNMFSPNHCKGQVLYWRAPGVARLPIIYQNGRITVRASVDGQEMDAVIDTGSPRSEMQISDAGRLFGLTASSPGVTPAGDDLYAYNFRTLSFGTVAIGNPHLALTHATVVRGANTGTQTGTLIRNAGSQPALVIGTDLLKLLHLYIAFNERMLYVTQGPELPEGDAKALPVVPVTPFRP